LHWFESNLGSADFRTIKPRHMTSTVVLMRGDFVESERLSRINLGILEEMEPQASSGRIGILINILDVLNQTGRFDEALELANEIYALAEGLHGPTHRRTLQARSNIGVTLTALGRYAEAATVFRENWTAERDSIGEYALDTLVSRGNLAEALLFAGELREAEQVATGAHAANIEALCADHFATLYFADILALSKLRLGNIEVAVALLETNLADKQRTLGEDNRMTWDTVAYLVEALLAYKQAERALPLAASLVAYRSAQHGDGHPKAAEAKALLEQAQQASGR
jgi:tetratricopeptide (TPR) repeat protein